MSEYLTELRHNCGWKATRLAGNKTRQVNE